MNKEGATQVTFAKYGMSYAFKLAMILAQWVTEGSLSQPIPDPTDPAQFEQLQEMIRKTRFPQLQAVFG